MEKLGQPESPYEPESHEDNEYHLRIIVPILIFLIKVFVNLSFNNAYICSFNEDAIFPFEKRATSIGICNFIARIFVILSPLVAEVDMPIPAVILISLNALAFLVSVFLPSRDDERYFNELALNKKQD